MSIQSALMAAFSVAFLTGSIEAPQPSPQADDITKLAQKAARLAVLESNPWQDMSDAERLRGIVYEPTR